MRWDPVFMRLGDKHKANVATDMVTGVFAEDIWICTGMSPWTQRHITGEPGGRQNLEDVEEQRQ